jgi:hypothetical protein
MGYLLAYKDLISFLIIRANGPDTAKDLFYPFLATPTAPHSKKQQKTLFIIETYTLAYQLFLISYIFYKLCGFTNRYLIHLFQGLKCLTLPIIETYSLWTYTCISICIRHSNLRYIFHITTLFKKIILK